MAADALVSLFIIAVVFACACPRHRPTLGEGRDRAGPGGRGVPRAAGGGGGPQGGVPQGSPGGDSGETLGAVQGGTPEETPEAGGPQEGGAVGGW